MSGARGSSNPWARQSQGGAPHRWVGTYTLIVLRGVYLAAEALIVFTVWKVLKWPFSPVMCLGLVWIGAAMNLLLALSPVAWREAKPWVVTGQLVFDVVQMGALLYLTGGVTNPFALLLIAPVTVAGGVLPPRYALMIGALAMGVAVGLAFLSGPDIGIPALSAGGAETYRAVRSMALILGIVFAGGYASWFSAQMGRRELALHVAETVLAQEQRMSALGALSAAVAHELGTPLATVSIIAREMALAAPEGPLREDATLLVEQAARCREILRRLAETPDRSDAMHERVSLQQFVSEMVDPYDDSTEVKVSGEVLGAPGEVAPDVWRRPEWHHAITAFVENAFDFAHSEIEVIASFDPKYVTVEVRDDGPGFAAAVMARLGEPYVTTRPGAEGSRTGHEGMGLGLFIAKTLLERTGAEVRFANAADGGAVVTSQWPRARVEAPSLRE